MADIVPFPPPSGSVQLRTLLNEHLRNYPDILSRRTATSQLKVMGRVTSVIMGPGSFAELGLHPLLERGIVANRGKGEYGAADADIQKFFASMQIDSKGFVT